jgi:hypothetical protein
MDILIVSEDVETLKHLDVSNNIHPMTMDVTMAKIVNIAEFALLSDAELSIETATASTDLREAARAQGFGPDTYTFRLMGDSEAWAFCQNRVIEN